MLTGEKCQMWVIGLKDSVKQQDCSNYSDDLKLKSILAHAMDEGKLIINALHYKNPNKNIIIA